MASLGKVVITDKVGKMVYGSMTVTEKVPFEEYTVTINAPVEFLTNPTTVYPVTVDPTLTINEKYSQMDDYGNDVYYNAIEDLCIYTGSGNPVSNHLASVGNYSYDSDNCTVSSARMLYRIPEDAAEYYNLDNYLSADRYFSAELYVKGYTVETDMTVYTGLFNSNWTSGTSLAVDEEEYYSHLSCDVSTTVVSNYSAQMIGIDITNPLSYFAENRNLYSEFNMYVSAHGEDNDGDEYCYDRIKVYQTEHTGSSVYIAIEYSDFSGSYYINSKNTGKFLDCPNAATVAQDVYEVNNTQAWQFSYLGSDNEYYISPNSQSTRVLVMDDSGDVFVGTQGNYDADNYTWQLNFCANVATIYNVGAGRYLYANTSGGIGGTPSASAKWRFCKTSAYVPLTSFSVADIVMEVGETVTPTITKNPVNATWANLSDFKYICLNNFGNGIVLDENNTFNSNTVGIAEYSIVHKATGQANNFSAFADRYTYELSRTFFFENSAAVLIRILYNKIDYIFANEADCQKAWKASRLLASFIYEGDYWDAVAGSVVSLDNKQAYFIDVLGYTVIEYNQIKNAIKDQHSTDNLDFAHMQYSLSARLAYWLNREGFPVPQGDLCINEQISYFAGWLGDATLAENGTTSLKNDDYCADLDAENIYRLIIEGDTYENAIIRYYSAIDEVLTRADVFLTHISYSYVKEQVFYVLIDAELYILMDQATRMGDLATALSIQTLISDEQYHINIVQNSYPDTYNFLMSLRDARHNIVEYY